MQGSCLYGHVNLQIKIVLYSNSCWNYWISGILEYCGIIAGCFLDVQFCKDIQNSATPSSKKRSLRGILSKNETGADFFFYS